MKAISSLSFAALIILAASCGKTADRSELTLSNLDPANFVTVVDGDTTKLVTLKNANGMEVCITNYAGRIVSIMVPDRDGNMVDVVLGFDSIQDYLPSKNLSDFGAAIGRYANRINQGKIVIDGDSIQLPQNNFGHCLHGGGNLGDYGWQYRMYNIEEVTDSTLRLSIDSPDGDNGFPGNVKAFVTYTLSSDNALRIDYSATTDKQTVINMTNHSYFNLSGDADNSILDETLWLASTSFTPVDSTFMTTGEVWQVKDTPMDFTNEKRIGDDIDKVEYEQIKFANGYDHNFILDTNGNLNEVAARLSDPRSGIVMEMFTNEPGVQIYTGNFLTGDQSGKGAKKYAMRHGICLETQKYPDTPNKPQWPSATLRPGEVYNSVCIYKFGVNK